MRLNLGCGLDILPGWVNVDIVQTHPSVEIVDLDDPKPWPFEDNAASEIRAMDIFEHVMDAVGFMTECHRILRPGGMLRIQTANWEHHTGYDDPTHRRQCTIYSMDYWIPGTQYYEQNPMYGGVAFERVQTSVTPSAQLLFVLRKP